MHDNVNIILKFKKEILFYLISRIILIWIIIRYLNSASFLDDIHSMYFFGVHPFCLITGSFLGEGIIFGAYAPLEPFIYAPFISIANDINGVRLVAFIFEFLSLLMMIIIGNDIIKENILHKAIFIYVIVPLSWVLNIIWAQDEILAAFFLLTIIFFKMKEREDLAALLLGMACIFSKIILLIILIPLIMTSKDKIKSLILTIFPVLIIYVPINLWYSYLGFESPFLVQILSANSNYALTIPYLLRIISNFNINWGILAFALLSASFIIYYSYLAYRYKSKDMPNFIDMVLVSFLIYLIFSFASIHPEQYIFILPIIILRLAMLDRLNSVEVLLLFAISASSITWKGLAMLRFLSENLTHVQANAIPHKALEIHNNLIGTQFFKSEEIIFLGLTILLILRYFLIFVKQNLITRPH